MRDKVWNLVWMTLAFCITSVFFELAVITEIAMWERCVILFCEFGALILLADAALAWWDEWRRSK